MTPAPICPLHPRGVDFFIDSFQPFQGLYEAVSACADAPWAFQALDNRGLAITPHTASSLGDEGLIGLWRARFLWGPEGGIPSGALFDLMQRVHQAVGWVKVTVLGHRDDGTAGYSAMQGI